MSSQNLAWKRACRVTECEQKDQPVGTVPVVRTARSMDCCVRRGPFRLRLVCLALPVRPSGTVPQLSANLTRSLRPPHHRDHVANRSICPIWINWQQQLLLRSISTNSGSLQRSEISASNSSRSRDPSFKRAYAALTITSHHQPILDCHAMMCSGDKTVLSGMR